MDIPKSIQEALKVPKWKKAVREEIEALEKKNGMWEMVYLRERKLIVGCKWIFTVQVQWILGTLQSKVISKRIHTNLRN